MDGGTQFAPRIPDESWSIRWDTAFNQQHALKAKSDFLIAGSIEFDFNQWTARWFDMWLTSQKAADKTSLSATPSIDSICQREEGQTISTSDHCGVTTKEENSVTIQRKVHTRRPVPRKPAPSDRTDTITSERNTRPVSCGLLSPTDANGSCFSHSAAAQTRDPALIDVGEEDAKVTKSLVDAKKKVQNRLPSSTISELPLHASTPGLENTFSEDQLGGCDLLDQSCTPRTSAPGGREPERLLGDSATEVRTAGPWRFVWPYHQASIDDPQAVTEVTSVTVHPHIRPREYSMAMTMITPNCINRSR